MKNNKESLGRIFDAIYAMGDNPDLEDIRFLRSQINSLSTLLQTDAEKLVCRCATDRLTSALKFKTYKKRKELLDQAKDKLWKLK